MLRVSVSIHLSKKCQIERLCHLAEGKEREGLPVFGTRIDRWS